jgi:DNA polymerase-1
MNNLFNNYQSPTSLNDRVLLVDGLNTWLRVWSSIPLISENGEHVGGIVGFLRSIGVNIRDFNPTRCLIVFDGKGGSMRRKKLYPEYKGNRSGKHNLRRDFFATKEEEQISMRNQLIRTINYLENLPVQVISMDNIEADDVIAYITSNYFEKEANKIRIVSTDRDFLQLVNEKVEVYSPVKKKLYTPETIKEEYELDSTNYLIYRVLNGDASDNISGVDGIGLKTLLKSFPDLTLPNYGLNGFLEHSKVQVTNTKKPKKIYENVISHQDLIQRNYELMQLHDVDISGTAKIKISETLQTTPTKTNHLKIRQLIGEDNLYNQFKNLDTWLTMTFNCLDIWTKH